MIIIIQNNNNNNKSFKREWGTETYRDAGEGGEGRGTYNNLSRWKIDHAMIRGQGTKASDEAREKWWMERAKKKLKKKKRDGWWDGVQGRHENWNEKKNTYRRCQHCESHQMTGQKKTTRRTPEATGGHRHATQNQPPWTDLNLITDNLTQLDDMGSCKWRRRHRWQATNEQSLRSSRYEKIEKLTANKRRRDQERRRTRT